MTWRSLFIEAREGTIECWSTGRDDPGEDFVYIQDNRVHMGSGEGRLKRLGASLKGRILLVVYTLRRNEHGKERVRIISARQASRKERKAYSGP